MASDEHIKLEIDRTMIDGFISLSMTFAIKEFVAGFAIELLDVERNQWIKPFGYHLVKIYYGDVLLLTGRIEKIDRSQVRSIKIEGRSLPAILIDASMPSPSQYHNVTLASLATELGQLYGIGVTNQMTNLQSYEKLTAEVDDKIHAFLNSCAEKENILLNSDAQGNILLRRYGSSAMQASFVAGQGGYQDASISFDGSQRFSSLTLLAQSKEDLELSHTIHDSSIKIDRPLVEKAEAPDLATLENIAKRRLALSISESIKLTVKLLGWHTDRNKTRLLEIGDMIQITDASLGLHQATSFIIEGMTLSLSNGDLSTNLSLALPNLYTEEPLEGVAPWA